jgi:hypothetical protein
MPAPQRPGFGRLISLDKRDELHPMRKLMRPATTLPESRIWHSKRAYVLNQGATPHCVGFAWATFLEASPYAHQLTNADGDRFYSLAQTLDEWPGPPPDYEGTSTRAGAKALQSLGLIDGEYVWAFDEAAVWNYVLARGPVVSGTTWLTGMMDTDSKGYVKLTGGEEGGHDWCTIGASKSRQAYRAQQTWGTDWGQSGRFWIKREDYKTLLETLGGDCCSATEVKAAA